MDKEDIQWACLDCGKKHGRRLPDMATWHKGKCDICGEVKNVTQPRDFGRDLLKQS